MKICPVILIGGTGTRLWPLSRANHPKQFIQFENNLSLFQKTVLRLRALKSVDRIVLVVNQNHYFLCIEQLRDLNCAQVDIIVEPESRNTAPAIACAAYWIMRHAGSEALMLVLPSDHHIADIDGFIRSIKTAATFADNQKLILFGVRPTNPVTGYGYIETTTNANLPVKITHFYEKPTEDKAKQLIALPHCYWNSGLFLFSVDAILSQLELYQSHIALLCQQAIQDADIRDRCCYLHSKSFAALPFISIDNAIMEKTQQAYVMILQSDWTDLGDWNAVSEQSISDENGNVTAGRVICESTQNSYLHSSYPLLATIGVDHLVVVASRDSVLVADKSKAQDVKKLVSQLSLLGFSEHIQDHVRVHRPWGAYEIIMKSSHFCVKHILVKPNAKLSLQSHQHRSEHWIVVKGIADVECDQKHFQVFENQSTYVSKNTKHRLMNFQSTPLELIEVQVGEHISEDDIIRYDDVYGRAVEVG